MNFIEKALVGAYVLVYNKKFHSFPKIAPIMVTALTLMGLFQDGSLANIPVLFFIGLGLLLIGLVGFFYFDLFPKRKPKTKEESMKFDTIINGKNA